MICELVGCLKGKAQYTHSPRLSNDCETETGFELISSLHFLEEKHNEAIS